MCPSASKRIATLLRRSWCLSAPLVLPCSLPHIGRPDSAAVSDASSTWYAYIRQTLGRLEDVLLCVSCLGSQGIRHALGVRGLFLFLLLLLLQVLVINAALASKGPPKAACGAVSGPPASPS